METVESMRAAIRALPLNMRSLVRPDVATACLLWRAGTDPKGYGRTWPLYGEVLAHRAVWAATHGPIPAGVRIRHRCSTPLCVNIDHLEAVEPVEPGTPGPRKRNRCKRGHSLLDDSNVYVSSSGKRNCRACLRQRRREYDRMQRGERDLDR